MTGKTVSASTGSLQMQRDLMTGKTVQTVGMVESVLIPDLHELQERRTAAQRASMMGSGMALSGAGAKKL